MDAIIGLLLLLGIIILYFLPTIVAIVNNHNYSAGIIILNLFLGWTFIGWLVALIWAVSPQPTVNK